MNVSAFYVSFTALVPNSMPQRHLRGGPSHGTDIYIFFFFKVHFISVAIKGLALNLEKTWPI